MDLFAEAFDDLNDVLARQPFDTMSTAERLQVVQVRALLSISQELSRIHHDGINPEYDDGR
ncbi:hypothetical protein [Micromonospora sp. NPDC005979]|uniref:hypothetical protein n=1 Tax=Micromonospora sp. NPDC005979 TaxID=3156726 RepID=UPI0033AFFFE9